jgi:sigma-B regulation protein RsbU (phosphoserine phosphatase)
VINDPEPETVLRHLNAVINHSKPRLCTVIYGRLLPDADGATVTMATGGHTPPLLIRADGTSELVRMPGGQLVGVLPNARFATTTVHLGPGDTLLLYTDGLTEARLDADTRYSEEALLDDLRGPASARSVIAAATRLLTGFGDGVEDDTALLALGVQAPGVQAPGVQAPGATSPVS